ncbi:MAG: hypothetical protein ACI4XB_01595 [Ruminococcus sp.]
MKERLQRLLCVKSVVTLILTLTFSVLSLKGIISGEQFATIFTTVISFYFGTQHERMVSKSESEKTE